MKILVLGHGKKYIPQEEFEKLDKKSQYNFVYFPIRCSPIPVEEWYNKEYTSVDYDSDVKPDIIYDLKKIPWSFAKDSSYDLIIDTCGIGLFTFRTYHENMISEIKRVLKPNGKFFGFRGQRVIKA